MLPASRWLVLILLLASAPEITAQEKSLGLRLPAGFEITEFADSRLANDIYCLTVDPRGQIVVAGRGYICLLVDDDKNGKADRAIDFADRPKDGAMGLLWEGDTLHVTGDGGLRRFFDKNGDGKADGPPELIRALKTGGEHAAHAIRRGPDGWLYVLCGNNTGIDKSYAQLATSPIKDPVAGCVLRLSPDLTKSEVVAHGFRNPYEMDFNPDGELFTFDSDNERCVSLPWYEFTRFYHVIPGGHHGWLSPQRAQWWRMPPYFPDVVPPVATLGRGSPTGVACYRHAQFPEEYRGGFFICDWTFGKVHFLKPRRSGSSYTAEPKVFLETVGDNGFAPTGIVVHPDTGDLYISIGGRGTRGAVYRVRYPAGIRPSLKEDAAKLAPRRRTLDGKVQTYAGRWPKSLRSSASDMTDPGKTLRLAAELLDERRTPQADRLAAVRLIQLALGDLVSRQVQGTVWEGYTLRRPLPETISTWAEGDRKTVARLPAILRDCFPSRHADLDRELSRTLALLEDPDPLSVKAIAACGFATRHPGEDLHYLIVLARLRGPRSADVTQRTADLLLGLDGKVRKQGLNRDRHWPLRVGELYTELARRDPHLNDALLRHAEFGRPDHALFAQATGFDQLRAAEIFLEKSKNGTDFEWNAELVGLLGHLPPKRSVPVLRELWDKTGLETAILPLLARTPEPADRSKFVRGLESPQPGTVQLCLQALEKLPALQDADEVFSLIRALGTLPENQKALRGRIAARLAKITGQQLRDDKQAWTAWFSKAHPKLAVRLTNPDGVDVEAWIQRLARLDWSGGNGERGREVFIRASCASCHSGGQALGPDLAGVTGRFSRPDLFTSILQPSRDISPRYQTTLVETSEGKVYQGLVIYEATDSLILQTGATTTVRLSGSQVASSRPVPASLMPAGLLDKLPDRDIADLYAYLKGLGKSEK
jgi:putative membrane-bound dehydrogenase-like protein